MKEDENGFTVFTDEEWNEILDWLPFNGEPIWSRESSFEADVHDPFNPLENEEIEYKGESILGKCWEKLLSFLNYINLVRYLSRKFGGEPIRANPLPIRRTREISLDDLERELNEEIDQYSPERDFEKEASLDEEYPHYCQNKEYHDLYPVKIQYAHARASYLSMIVEKEGNSHEILTKYGNIFEKHWKLGYLQFYCCQCYRELKKEKKII